MNDVLAAIRSRRVARSMDEEPVGREALAVILDAARWAPNAGGTHRQRMSSRTTRTLPVLRMVSPDMIARRTAAIAISTDWSKAVDFGFRPDVPGPWIDVGTAAATILLAVHSIGIGAGPVTSFSKAALSTLLRLPDGLEPGMIVGPGHPASGEPVPIRRGPLSCHDLTTCVP